MKEELPEQRVLELAEKWLNGTITPNEAAEYARWYNTIDPNFEINIPASAVADKETYRSILLQKIKEGRKIPVISIRKRIVYGAAAAAVAIGFAIGITYLASNDKNPVSENSPVVVAHDINPGTTGAILKLANGTTINLDTAANGALLQNTSYQVTKENNGIAFKAEGIDYLTTFSELITPRARQQQVTLADGTKVWLNAASSIKFPNSFSGNQRIVEISGEVYFDVAKDASKPFIVKVRDAEITVLGTQFNVMAYNEESAMKTTLVEGAVRFNKGTETVQMKPGQQTILQKSGELKLVKGADIETAIAWKNGIQAFQNVDLHTIMRELERWYDLDVEYNGKVPTGTFSGEIPRTATLSEVLKLFQVTKINIKVDAERKKITITP